MGRHETLHLLEVMGQYVAVLRALVEVGKMRWQRRVGIHTRCLDGIGKLGGMGGSQGDPGTRRIAIVHISDDCIHGTLEWAGGNKFPGP